MWFFWLFTWSLIRHYRVNYWSNFNIVGSQGLGGLEQRDWCWSWNSNTLATSCKELTHWKRFWCLEGLGAGGEGDDRGWDGWMASLTRWTWVWVNSGSWWWTGRPGVLRFMGLQRVGHDWVTELNWTEQREKDGGRTLRVAVRTQKLFSRWVHHLLWAGLWCP